MPSFRCFSKYTPTTTSLAHVRLYFLVFTSRKTSQCQEFSVIISTQNPLSPTILYQMLPFEHGHVSEHVTGVVTTISRARSFLGACKEPFCLYANEQIIGTNATLIFGL